MEELAGHHTSAYLPGDVYRELDKSLTRCQSLWFFGQRAFCVWRKCGQ